jgi:Ca2+-binding EF-hand superfamily protein
MAKEEFIDFMIEMMKKYDFCDTQAEQEVMASGFDDVFECFDYNKNGKLDAEEIANCLALMCGGTINQKIFAAFNLFDINDSMTLSFDELNKFIKCVFQIFYQVRDTGSGPTVWD